MKEKQLRAFLTEFLGSQGAEVESRGDHLLSVRVPKKIAPALGSREIVLAFDRKGIEEDPRSELGMVGNPVFDRILELARTGGRAGERFAPLPTGRGKSPAPLDHFRFTRPVTIDSPEPVYTPLYFFIFRVEYSLENTADELEIVPVDGISMQTLGQTPEISDYWEGLEGEPATRRKPRPAYPVPRDVVSAALALTEKRLKRRLSKLRRASSEHLERETRSIEAYYTQLIAETRNAGRRWVVSAESREERIRLLQLDWKRRIEEAQQSWRPTLMNRLASIVAVQKPRLEFRVRSGSNGSDRVKNAPRLYWDETDRAFVEPACLRCGTVGQIELAPVEGGFLCPRCDNPA